MVGLGPAGHHHQDVLGAPGGADEVAVQRPLVTPAYGFFFVIPALVGVVVGGMDRLVAATLGGFVIGFATSFVADRIPSEGRPFLTSYIFGFVIFVLLVKPNGLFTRRRRVERV